VDVGENLLVGNRLALADQLFPAAPGAGLGGGGDIQLGRGVRGDDVPMSRPSITAPGSWAAKARWKSRSTSRTGV